MNSAAGAPEEKFAFASFNQDCTSLAVGTSKGFHLFGLRSTDRVEQQHFYQAEGGVILAERLFGGALVAVVTHNSPQQLRVVNINRAKGANNGAEILSHHYSNDIISVTLNRQRLVACLERSLHIHNIKDLVELHTIFSPPNLKGLQALSVGDLSLLAYPSNVTVGHVAIFDTLSLKEVATLEAHSSPVVALAFDPAGTKLATASQKGTVIRVFSLPDGQRIFEFRRGLARCASISTLAFDGEGMWLAAASNTETIHVFRATHDSSGDGAESWAQWGGWVFGMMSQVRAFAMARPPHPAPPYSCALCKLGGVLRVLVCSADGHLLVFALDTTAGGTCSLVCCYRLLGEMSGPDGEVKQDISQPLVPLQCQPPCRTYAQMVAPAAESVEEEQHAGILPEDEIAAATFRLDDDEEFPPMASHTK
uniref:WD repeat domain phosphoinositide-interacting protein 2-like n=1 Tax=Myxine glutinosa TaxID=7769 RepID=UPI00358E28ED